MLLYIQENKSIFKNKRILELGAGLGLPTKFINLACDPIQAVASDIDIVADQTMFLAWDEPDKEHVHKYDVIIASDCIYRYTHESLFKAINYYMNENGRFIVINAKREGLDDFMYACEEAFENTSMSNVTLEYNNKYKIDLTIISNICELL